MNLRIEKRGGTSSNGTGLPGTYSGSVQTLVPSSVSWNATASRWEVVLSVSGFSGFFAKSTTFALPARLLSFTAEGENGLARLKWKTADEINIKEYVVESSEDGNEFMKMAKVSAGSASHDYAALDSRVATGTRYYRLRIVDIDGSFTYSHVVSFGKRGNGISVYPNPASDQLRITLPGSQNIMHFELSDMNGRAVLKGNLNNANTSINVSKLPTGLYALKIMTPDDRIEEVQKVSIQH
jgi:hypothetical protein